MTEHYYSEKPTTSSNRKQFRCELRDRTFTFYSDHGVFSREGIDFGTRLLIEQFQFPDEKGALLDVGCGYGPIGISLATETDEEVYLVDINERAIELAKDNARLNEVSNVKIFQSDLLAQVDKRDFAAIITNPPIRAGKQTVFSIYEQAVDHLKDGGELWVVIQKKQGAPSTIEKLKQLFREVETVHKEKGYFIIRAKKV